MGSDTRTEFKKAGVILALCFLFFVPVRAQEASLRTYGASAIVNGDTLQDIIVMPSYRRRDYKRKNNPAIELMKQVITHQASNTIRAKDYYTATTYSRASFAADDLHINFQKGIWKHLTFAEKYIDSTGTTPRLTVSMRELAGEEFYRRDPHREKKILQRKRVVGAEDLLGPGTFRQMSYTLFRDVDLYANSSELLSNRFVSPLSSTNAISFYRYYILDTLLVDGMPCIDVYFMPDNSQGYGFKGHFYITNDSTYRIRRYILNVPEEINLNFVNSYVQEGSFGYSDSGEWVPQRTNTSAQFHVFNKKHPVRAQQTKIYTGWDTETHLDKRLFSDMTAEEVAINDSTAERVADSIWAQTRPEPLTRAEESVVDLLYEFTHTPRFNNLMLFGHALSTGFIPTTPSYRINESKFDFGPIYSFLSWNMLEGVRLRVGGTTKASLHPQLYARGYIAFGTKDLRPKYEATLIYTFDKHKYHPYDGIRHHLLWTAMYDVEQPGQNEETVRRDHILNSIPTEKPKMGKYLYVFHAKMEYMKEWQNRLALRTSFDFTHNEPAGTLSYLRPFRDYTGLVELRYSPRSPFTMDCMGYDDPLALDTDAPIFRLMHYVGYLDDRYQGGRGYLHNTTELMIDKRFSFPAFGQLDTRLKAGYIWDKVPFTHLFAPKTSTGILLNTKAFNLMRPMEFVMDKYIALYATYHFNGWILNRIPGINKLRLRGVVSFAGIYGGLSQKNNPSLSDGLYPFPEGSSPIGALPYMELTAGFENIFQFLRIDYVRRLTYTANTSVWGRNGIKVTVRLTL